MVRGLVMGPGTDYIVSDFNPYASLARVSYSGENPFGDGSWAGPEFRDSVQIPLIVHPVGESAAGWWALHTQLLTALRPIDIESTEPEIHWRNGGQDFMMFARPRAIQPSIRNMTTGDVTTSCSLLALDPSIYSGGEAGLHSVEIGEYRTVGGLRVPFGLPLAIRPVVADGLAVVTNTGIRPTKLFIRITGPVTGPLISTNSQIAGASTLQINVTLAAGDYIDIDTEDQTVLQNGTVNLLGEVQGEFPLAYPGETEIQYRPSKGNNLTRARIQWRDRW
jgi:hypothetical protein